MNKFTEKDFPIDSKFRLYKIVDIQVDPLTRKKGESKYIKGYVFCELKVGHHLRCQNKWLVGSEFCDSNEGFCVSNSRFSGEGFLIIPQQVYKTYPIKSGNPVVDTIINTTNREIKNHCHNSFYHPNAQVIRDRVAQQRKETK